MSDGSTVSRYIVSPSITTSKLSSIHPVILITELILMVIFHPSKPYGSDDTLEMVLENNTTVSVDGESCMQLRRRYTRHVSLSSV